jgi:uncharacterized protein (TIGR03067 family)
MKMRWFILGIAACAVGAAPTTEQRKEMAKFNGNWKYLSISAEGQRAAGNTFANSRMGFKDDKFTLAEVDDRSNGVFAVDPTQNPKWINLRYLTGARQGQLLLGVYEIEGDSLRISLGTGGNRPADFESKVGQMVITLGHLK